MGQDGTGRKGKRSVLDPRATQARAIDELPGPCRGRYLRVTNVNKCQLYLFSTLSHFLREPGFSVSRFLTLRVSDYQGGYTRPYQIRTFLTD